MRSGPNTRRPMRRGSNNGGGGRRGGSPRSQSFDSNGPDIKVRGNAQQVVDKYQALAREASTAGNPVMAENYYQHAEHYFRVLNANGGGDNRQGNRPPDNNSDARNNENGADGNSQQKNGAAPAGVPETVVTQNAVGPNNQDQKANTEAAPATATVEPPAESAPVEAAVNKEAKSEEKVGKKAEPAKSEEETAEPAA